MALSRRNPDFIGRIDLQQGTFYFPGGHGLDLFEFGSLKTKEGCHLHNLVFTYKVFWIGAELFDSRLEFAATHGLGKVEPHAAFAALGVVQTEFTNDHFLL